MAKKHHELKQTKAFFTVKGTVTKTEKDDWLNIKPKDKDRKFGYAGCNLAIKTTVDSTVYGITISGCEADVVRYAYAVGDKKELLEIGWGDRYNNQLINSLLPVGAEPKLNFAKNIGLWRETYVDKNDGKEKEKTVSKQLTSYDAVLELKKAKEEGRFTDGTSVFISGNVKPNSYSYKDDKGETHKRKTIKLEAGTLKVTNPIVLSELSEEDALKTANFDIELVIKEFNKIDNEMFVTGILVGYDYIEEMEFKFLEEAVGEGFYGLFSPYLQKGIYPKIRCTGVIYQEFSQEEVEVKPTTNAIAFNLGEPEKCASKRKGSAKTVWAIVGGYQDTIDTETYTVENVDEAKKSLQAYLEDYKAGKTVTEIKEETKFNLGTTSSTQNMDDFEDDEEDWD